jgi:hypothetical protein
MDTILDLARPLEILFSWQALLVAITVAGLVRFIKAIIDAVKGSEWRKARKWIELFLLPSLAVFLGALTAVIVPLHPDVMTEYLDKVPEAQQWAIPAVYALWGAACGQFSSYTYDRVVAVLRAGAPLLERALDTVKKAAKTTSTPPPPPDEAEELDDGADPGEPLER